MSILLDLSKDRPQTLLMPRFDMPPFRHDAIGQMDLGMHVTYCKHLATLRTTSPEPGS